MTRFFLTIEEAIKLVFKATFESIGGEIFVMKMPSCKIIDLAEVLIQASNKGNVDVEVLDIACAGEKLHEILLSEYESTTAIAYDEEYYVILPAIHIEGIKEHYSKYQPVSLEDYNSGTGLMGKAQIKEMLKKGGFI